MLTVTRPTSTQFGIYVSDHDRMVALYAEIFELTVTDRGEGRNFKSQQVFLSASADQHHQLVIASGRPADARFSTVMQLSFMVPGIQHLRDIWARAEARGATQIRGMNHGDALSVYMADPEGNTVEVYLDMPWYITQPHGDPLDLGLSDEALLLQTETICRADPSFMPIEDWQQQFNQRGKP